MRARHAPEFKQDNPTSKQFNNKPSKAVKERYSKLMKKYGDPEKMSGAKTSKDVFIFEYWVNRRAHINSMQNNNR